MAFTKSLLTLPPTPNPVLFFCKVTNNFFAKECNLDNVLSAPMLNYSVLERENFNGF